jgi:hypothetical protein
MSDLCRLIFGIVVDLFWPRAAMEAEILVLRQQIIVLRRGRPGRMAFLTIDRMVLGWICQLFPKTREALAIVRPSAVVRWHRALVLHVIYGAALGAQSTGSNGRKVPHSLSLATLSGAASRPACSARNSGRSDASAWIMCRSSANSICAGCWLRIRSIIMRCVHTWG